MTEEREKCLAQIWQDKWIEETSGTLHVGTMFIRSIIHAIAAESREEADTAFVDATRDAIARAEKAEVGETKAIKVLEGCEQMALNLKARVRELEKEVKEQG